MKNNKQITKLVSAFICDRYVLKSTDSVLVVDDCVLISLETGLPLDFYDYPQSIYDFIADLATKHPDLLVDIKNPGCLTVSNA